MTKSFNYFKLSYILHPKNLFIYIYINIIKLSFYFNITPKWQHKFLKFNIKISKINYTHIFLFCYLFKIFSLSQKYYFDINVFYLVFIYLQIYFFISKSLNFTFKYIISISMCTRSVHALRNGRTKIEPILFGSIRFVFLRFLNFWNELKFSSVRFYIKNFG